MKDPIDLKIEDKINKHKEKYPSFDAERFLNWIYADYLIKNPDRKKYLATQASIKVLNRIRKSHHSLARWVDNMK